MITEPCLEIGVVSKAHGFEGAVKIELRGVVSLKLKPKEPLFLRIDQKLVPFFITAVQQGDQYLVCSFEDVNTQDSAREIAGYKVFAREKSVKSDPLLNLGLLEGYTVTDKEAGPLGTITSVVESNKQSLLIMHYKFSEVLIPVNEDILLNADPVKRVLHVDLPDGLLSLYLNEWDDEN